jgi:hypothetical protein
LLTFETPEKDPSKEVAKDDDSTRGSRRVCVSFYIDVSKANHSRALGDEMVSIYVSPKRKKFLAHKKLICEASDFFSKGSTEGFQEAQENSMHLPEDDPNAFALFMDWIYRSKIPERKKRKDQATLYNLYIFAEKLCLDDLANATMDQIHNLADSLDHSFDQYSTLISKVYTETSFDSPLRKFCSHLMAFDLWVETIAAVPLIGDTGLQKAWIVCKDNVDLFKDFSSLIMTSSVEEESLDPCYSGGDDRCDFYKHRDGESCT